MNLLIDSSKEILIVLEENAELNLVTNLINAKKDAEISFEIDLMENSKLNYLNMQNFPLIAHLNNKIIKLEKNSVFNYYELKRKTAFIRIFLFNYLRDYCRSFVLDFQAGRHLF